MGYVSDWDAACEARREHVEWAKVAIPDCTSQPDCPADAHDLLCRRFRRSLNAAGYRTPERTKLCRINVENIKRNEQNHDKTVDKPGTG